MDQPHSAPSQAEAGPEQGRERPRDDATVGAGPGAPASAHLEEDRYIGVRVNFTRKPAGPLPPEEASEAGEEMSSGEMTPLERAADATPPIQDVRVAADEPSVWEAVGRPKE